MMAKARRRTDEGGHVAHRLAEDENNDECWVEGEENGLIPLFILALVEAVSMMP
ncbi:hypothetical protein MCOR31_012043 [Pyricularia oryzae]|uniref:Uncharacterized protein n=1 Tax=Pyricularia grisea TaxID=148305 RepID=A0ABQ8NYU0_PYRGI|nr:hypothetical protein MCOR19_008124 [Pyricularia oryzae]KAI6304054.1 hypothetical protein MCOR33_000800 [Pyricularia grisea]KAI6348832.1 hypothetical protein MCOR30_000098 [Pyricularia oryzae]KAI6350972.1 hypothetical protein MCOR31_012043 [Pyricularia oryzae]KAI6479051.1 hypothetical protein MCOR18_005882 [Pyricularia oryzae]